MKRKRIAVIGRECVACGSCVKGCKVQAIEIVCGITAEVNVNKCVGCGKCALICPAGVIEIMERENEEKSVV